MIVGVGEAPPPLAPLVTGLAGPSCFSARLLVKCVAADVEGLHVDMTVHVSP